MTRDDTLCSPYHHMLICDVTSTPMTAEQKQVQAISLVCRRLSPLDGMRHMHVTQAFVHYAFVSPTKLLRHNASDHFPSNCWVSPQNSLKNSIMLIKQRIFNLNA